MDKKIFIPSNRFLYIFGTVLLVVLVMALPDLLTKMFSIASLNPSMSVAIGWPVPFFQIDILNMTTMPIRWFVMIFSLIGYLVVSYIFDIVISIIIAGFTGPEKPEAVMMQARKAYYYYKSQGLEDSKIRLLFKQKGWKDEDIDKLK
jgi:hypothetical protein